MSEKPFHFNPAAGNDWNNCAREYARYSGQLPFYQAIAQRLVGLTDGKEQVILDFGCGDGRFTREYLRQHPPAPAAAKTIYLVDAAKGMLQLTEDINEPEITALRLQDAGELASIPEDAMGTVDLIACNSSLHLLKSEQRENFMPRASRLLQSGGRILANLPDQDYDFKDGWQSRFVLQADAVFGKSKPRPPAAFSREMLTALAYQHGFSISIFEDIYPLSWPDFITFYSIPFMGARRMPTTNKPDYETLKTDEERLKYLTETQKDRLKHLASLEPRFDSVEYRWVSFVMERQT